jgi:plasmid maintenance system antidote protein VapI
MQALARRIVGDTNGFAVGTYCPRAHLPLSQTPRRTAWIHQEDTHHARGRSEASPKTHEGVAAMSRKHMGSSIDDFMKQEGIFEETQAQAVKEVVAWQLAEAMKRKKISKSRMAAMLKTSRSQVDRLLDSRDDITLLSLQRAAAMVGKRVSIELI